MTEFYAEPITSEIEQKIVEAFSAISKAAEKFFFPKISVKKVEYVGELRGIFRDFEYQKFLNKGGNFPFHVCATIGDIDEKPIEFQVVFPSILSYCEIDYFRLSLVKCLRIYLKDFVAVDVKHNWHEDMFVEKGDFLLVFGFYASYSSSGSEPFVKVFKNPDYLTREYPYKYRKNCIFAKLCKDDFDWLETIFAILSIFPLLP